LSIFGIVKVITINKPSFVNSILCVSR